MLPEPEKPAWFLPISGRLYFRKSQLPVGPDGIVEFRTKCELAVELLREQPHHQGQAPGRFRRRLRLGERGPATGPARRQHTRIDFLTRLRCDARLYALPLPPEQRPKGKPGPQPTWGKRLEPPRRGGMWKAKWQVGTAFVYGRQRTIRWKEIICLWRVLGWEVPVKVIVASVEGYKERFTLVTSAVELTGLQMVELFTARFRQEDGFRDLKQRLGWEECRAWTANPIQRTSQAQWVTMSLLRLLQFRLEASGQVGWWLRPPWNKKKDRPSVLDAERLMRRHREQIQRLLRSGREMREKPRETRHERGVRGYSAGIGEVLPQPVQKRETLGGEAGPLERRGCYAPSSDCTVFRGNYCVERRWQDLYPRNLNPSSVRANGATTA